MSRFAYNSLMSKWKKISVIALIAIAAGVAAFVFLGKNSGKPPAKPKVAVKSRPHRKPRVQRGRPVRPAGIVKKEDEVAKEEAKKPTFSFDDDDEANLTEVQRKMIEDIRAALDEEDTKKVLKLVQKLQKSPEWPDGIPKSIKMAAIEALGWFGAACLPELAGFLADADEEVVEAAVDQYEEMLSDSDLGDRERAEILLQAVKIITDSDALDSMLFELNNMRNSVAVQTIKHLMVEGNAETKALLPETIEFVTGEEGLDTPEKLDKWLQENPDDDDDEETYGPSKD